MIYIRRYAKPKLIGFKKRLYSESRTRGGKVPVFVRAMSKGKIQTKTSSRNWRRQKLRV